MMKSLLSKALLTSALLVSSSFASVIFEAEGSGKDVASAKKEALSQLSSLIAVKVDSTTTSNLRSESTNGKENISALREQKSKITSNSFLVGVEYDEILTASNEPKEYKAILSDEALKKSIIALNDDLSKDLSSLSLKEMQELLQKSEFLLVLLSYNSKIVKKESILQKRDFLFNALHKSRVKLEIVPENAEVFIDEKKYKNNQVHFLSAGKHKVEAKLNGYLPTSKTIYTQVAKVSEVRLSLMKKSALPSTMAIKGAKGFVSDIKRELLKYNIKYSTSSEYTLQFSSKKEFITEVSGMKIYRLSVVADLLHNGSLVQSKKAKLKSVVSSQLAKKELALFKALLKAQVKALSKK